MPAVVADQKSAVSAQGAEQSQRPNKWKLLLAGLGLSAAVTLLTLLLIEAVLHVINYPPAQTSHQRLFLEFDSVRGWRNIAGATGTYVTEDYAVDIKYNSHGIRGPVRPYAKPPGTLRIILLGDSFVDGYSVPLGKRVSEVLEQTLGRQLPSRRIEVIALGAAGYSTDQELLWLEQEGLRYNPDVVVLMFYENDVWYNDQARYWRGEKPLYVLRGDSLTLTNVPVSRTALEQRTNRTSIRDLIENHSKLYWIAAAAIKSQPRLQALAIRLGLAEVPPEMILDAGDQVAVPAEFSVYRATATPEVKHAWRTTQALIARMQQRVTQPGARFMVFLIPFRADVYTRDAGVRSATQRGAQGWDAEAVARELLRICSVEKAECLDPTDRFRRAAAEGGTRNRLYFKNDWHWNERGHAFAAAILAEQLLPTLSGR